MTEVIRLNDIRDIPELPGQKPPEPSWRRIDLLADKYRTPPDPPAIHGLLYQGKRHVVSGPPESAKTLIVYALLLEALRAEQGVAIIDFEMGPHAAVTLIRELGATETEIGAILYFEPTEEPYDGLTQHLLVHNTQYVLIDASAGAYDIAGLDDNARKDVEQFAAKWIRPLWVAGIATIVIDHVTKNTETRGKFTIGSERKLGAADVHLGLQVKKPLSRGGNGIVNIHVHKDRPGYLTRPHAATINLTSHPDTHNVTWAFHEHTEEWKPTHLMEKVSRHLELHGPASKADIKRDVEGKNEWIVKAVDALLAGNYVFEVVPGKLGTTLTHNRPYTEETDPDRERSQVVPDPSVESGNVPPPIRGNGNDPEPDQDEFPF